MMLTAIAPILFLLTLFQNTGASDFDDLGRGLVGGFATAVLLAIAVVVIKRRAADKDAPAHFISISAKDARDAKAADHK